jgi:hypothetical protein
MTTGPSASRSCADVKLLDSYAGSNSGDVHEVDTAWTLQDQLVAARKNGKIA